MVKSKQVSHTLESKKHNNASNPILIVGATISLFFLAQFIASLIIFAFANINGWQEAELQKWFKESSLAQFIFVALADSLILFGVWSFLRKKGSTFKQIGLSWPKIKDVGFAISGYFVYMLIFLVITALAKVVFPSLDMNQQQEIGFEANKGLINLGLAFISLVILPPIVEEILVRGYLFTGLRKSFNFVIATIITSLVFGAAHLQFGSETPLLWIAFLDTFALSIILVYLREKTGRLSASIILHGLKNLIAFSLLFIFVK